MRDTCAALKLPVCAQPDTSGVTFGRSSITATMDLYCQAPDQKVEWARQDLNLQPTDRGHSWRRSAIGLALYVVEAVVREGQSYREVEVPNRDRRAAHPRTIKP